MSPGARDNPQSGSFRRVLGTGDLVLFGIICITPIATIPPFGIAQKLSGGYATDTILIAMLAMLITAVSYGRMSALYPVTGSAYTYVGRGLNEHLGFLAGWAMFLDYLLIPMINVIYCGATMYRLVPAVPYAVWAALFAAIATWLNIAGLRTGARANQVVLGVTAVVVAAFVIAAMRYLIAQSGWHGLLSLRPFYDRTTFDLPRIGTATSFAALTYIGFDSVTTLAEEVRNPRRAVPLATVLVCLITGVFGGGVAYLGQLVWPDYGSFPSADTAFMDVTRRVGGAVLFNAMAAIIIVAQFGSAFTGQAGAARLLFGMARDRVLPPALFGRLHSQRNVPVWNIVFIGILSTAGAMLFDFEHGAEVLNFGAFLAFMGVNLAVIRTFYFCAPAHARGLVKDLLLPLAGFVFCLAIWFDLPRAAHWIGGIWLLVGLVYEMILSRGFRQAPGVSGERWF